MKQNRSTQQKMTAFSVHFRWSRNNAAHNEIIRHFQFIVVEAEIMQHTMKYYNIFSSASLKQKSCNKQQNITAFSLHNRRSRNHATNNKTLQHFQLIFIETEIMHHIILQQHCDTAEILKLHLNWIITIDINGENWKYFVKIFKTLKYS